MYRLTRTLLLTMALAACMAAHGQAPVPEVFNAWASTEAIALPPCATDSDTAGLQPIAPVIGDARVIALGEPAHGAHEPLAFRNCLFRYLVEHHGFTAIALETGLNESRRLWDYVAGGPGDAKQLLRDSFSWGFWRYAENAELIEWMHSYNANPANQVKIRFYGIDMSGGEASGEWLKARITLDAALSWLTRVVPDGSLGIRTALEPFLDRFTLSGYQGMSSDERLRLSNAIGSLIGFFDQQRATPGTAFNESEFAWAKRNAVLAHQLEAMFSVSRPAGSGFELMPDDYRADDVRDAAMADNARWVIEREGDAGRVLLFAHNGHVVNAPVRGGPWSIYRQAPKAMGQHLRAWLGDQMVIIATSAATNGPGAPQGKQPPGTLDRALAEAVAPPALLDLRRMTPDAVAEWLTREQSMRTNFTTESILAPGTAMDAIVFFECLSPQSNEPTTSSCK